MKRDLHIFLVILVLLFIPSCNKKDDNKVPHTHDWVDATCIAPKKCLTCNKTVGIALGHNWKNATMNEPKTCSKCGITDGEPIGEHDHIWTKATCVALSTCEVCGETTGTYEEHKTKWLKVEGVKCGETYTAQQYCKICYKIIKTEEKVKEHNLVEIVLTEGNCTAECIKEMQCSDCEFSNRIKIAAPGHELVDIKDREPTDQMCGTRHRECKNCEFQEDVVEYAGNGFSDHGKLSVKGPDLVDKNNEKFQLLGLSTHGLQWFGSYVNYDTFRSLRDGFGINVIRLSLYTSENGYCTSGPARKEELYQIVVRGIKYATDLDMYVIIDWHMLGADDERDENPLFYKKEAVEFFTRITTEFKGYDNLLFDIMNEPSGDTTWKNCKDYANLVIPAIRNNSDGIVIVGNPHWSADLKSVMSSPLTGYENIMYSYHFYAGDKSDPYNVKYAYNKGFPVFISEHGGMESTGDGPIYYEYIEAWYKALDALNISYVAWNISSSKGSASIFKMYSYDKVSVNDDNLKEWGIYYRNRLREKLKFSKYIQK